MLKVKKQKIVINLKYSFYSFIILVFPSLVFGSDFGSPKEYFLFSLVWGGVLGVLFYLVFGGLHFYFNKNKYYNAGFKKAPFIIAVFGFFLVTLLEIVSMNMIPGIFGGFLTGYSSSTLIYLFLIKNIKR